MAKRRWVNCPCGKRGYRSESAVKKAFARNYVTYLFSGQRERKHTKGGNRIGTYQCPKSRLWHATDLEKSQCMGKSREERARRRQETRSARRNWRRNRNNEGEENAPKERRTRQ